MMLRKRPKKLDNRLWKNEVLLLGTELLENELKKKLLHKLIMKSKH
jgi:hypothetical protein